MSVLCGWASIDERGKASGGKAGDQTGREVKTGPWYYFGQTQVFRWKNRKSAHAYAVAIKALCNNDRVGYDQGQRATLFNILKANGWDYKKVKKDCETDCSALAGGVVNCVAKKETIPSWVYTGNLSELLMRTGLFTKLTADKYTKKSDYLMEGDIINNPLSHVIACLQDGPKAGKKEASKITTKGVNYPERIKQGRSFGMYGTIKSALTMTRIEIGVVDGTGKKWTRQKYDLRVACTSFSIERNADPVVKFGQLAPGEYYYRCWVWDKNGAHRIFNHKFVIYK